MRVRRAILEQVLDSKVAWAATTGATSGVAANALLRGCDTVLGIHRSSETEARALREGVRRRRRLLADALVGIVADLPTGLDRIDCPVVLAQGTADLVAVGQAPRYLTTSPAARFVPLLGAA